MNATPSLRQTQSGSFLLEALIGILIFTFGILGLVGLQAQALRVTSDTEYRAEAAFLANRMVSEMWVADQTAGALKASYDSNGAGAGYTKFQNLAIADFPGVTAAVNSPTVLFNDEINPPIAAPSQQGNVVQITFFWRLPGDLPPPAPAHQYVTTAVIGKN